MVENTAAAQWVRLLAPVGAEDQALRRIFAGHEHQVKSVAFSPDGKQILTGSRDRMARLWETATGKLLMKFTHQDTEVFNVAISPDGKRILTGSYSEKSAYIWDISSGKLLTILRGHQDAVHAVVFSPDGSKVLTGSYDHTARLWDAS